MTSEPTGYVMTPLGMRPVYADHIPKASRKRRKRRRVLIPVFGDFSGNAHQRRVQRRAWLRGDT